MITTVLLAILAMLLHELGHITAAWLIGCPVKRVGVNWKGVYIVRPSAPTKLKNVFVGSAGLLTNLVLLFMSLTNLWITFGMINAFMIFFNLLMPQSDGWRMVSYVWNTNTSQES